jgi:hypothetical protein
VFVEIYRRSPTQVRTFAKANGRDPQVARSEYSPSKRLSFAAKSPAQKVGYERE